MGNILYYSKPLKWERKKILIVIGISIIYSYLFLADYNVRRFFISVHNDFLGSVLNIEHRYELYFATIFFCCCI